MCAKAGRGSAAVCESCFINFIDFWECVFFVLHVFVQDVCLFRGCASMCAKAGRGSAAACEYIMRRLPEPNLPGHNRAGHCPGYRQ